MKVYVLKGFKDKNTGEKYYPGRKLEMEAPRVAEIMESIGEGYISFDESEEGVEAKEKPIVTQEDEPPVEPEDEPPVEPEDEPPTIMTPQNEPAVQGRRKK